MVGTRNNPRNFRAMNQQQKEAKQQNKKLRQQQATIASNAAKRKREETEESPRPSTPVPKTREESTQTNTKESCDASTQTEVKESCESSTQTHESTAFATANLLMMQSRIKMFEEANSRLIKLNEELVTKMRITNATTPPSLNWEIDKQGIGQKKLKGISW
ncbi:hypothetical protein ACQ4LE_004242 [Meloidogyne hapla]